MFKIGDVVMHPSAGVCEIDDIREEKFSDTPLMYYVMHPMGKAGKSTLYVPVDGEKTRLRWLLSEAEVAQVIRGALRVQIDWIDNNNLRKTTFTAISRDEDVSRVIALVSRFHKKQEELNAIGKKLSVTDERIMHEAEKKIHQEFAISLDLDEEDIPAYIVGKLREYQEA